MSYNYSELNQLLTGLDSDGAKGVFDFAAGAGIWGVIAAILAIVGGILVYFLFVKSKTEPKGKFAKWLKDFLSFKIIWLEAILKVVYYAATIFVILFSFTFLGAIGVMGGIALVMFLACLVLGPVLVRVGYEMTMMFIMIWHNTRDIANNTKKK